MASKEEVKKLINRIIVELKVPNQETVSIGAGYKKKTLTQQLSKGEDLDAIHKRLLLVYGDRLNKSTQPPTLPVQVNAGLIETLLQTQNKILSELKDGIQNKVDNTNDKVNGMEFSLKQMLEGQNISQAHLKALLQLSVVEMAKIQKRNPVDDLKKANKVVAENLREILGKGNL